jgi:hypothetical protein
MHINANPAVNYSKKDCPPPPPLSSSSSSFSSSSDLFLVTESLGDWLVAWRLHSKCHPSPPPLPAARTRFNVVRARPVALEVFACDYSRCYVVVSDDGGIDDDAVVQWRRDNWTTSLGQRQLDNVCLTTLIRQCQLDNVNWETSIEKRQLRNVNWETSI